MRLASSGTRVHALRRSTPLIDVSKAGKIRNWKERKIVVKYNNRERNDDGGSCIEQTFLVHEQPRLFFLDGFAICFFFSSNEETIEHVCGL